MLVEVVMHRVVLILGLLACTLFMCAPVLAEVPPPHGAPGDHGAGEPAKPSIFAPALDLTLWTIVVFVILLWVLGRYAWKPMLAGLQQREQNILAAQEEAKKNREEAQRLRDELQQKMDAAAAQVREMFEKARREAQGAADEMTAKARADIQAERDRLRRELDTAGDQVLQGILNRVGQMVTLASSKVIRRELTGDDHRRLVDEALKDLGEANVDWKQRISF
jgi:F-type H+-transporting ATPase subunit b